MDPTCFLSSPFPQCAADLVFFNPQKVYKRTTLGKQGIKTSEHSTLKATRLGRIHLFASYVRLMWSFSNPLRSVSRFAQAMSIGEQCKMVLVVRKDLQMGVGKIAAQCSHAALGGVESIRETPATLSGGVDDPRAEIHKKWLDAWFITGSAKIVAQASSEEELHQIYEKTLGAGLPSFQVVDAGRTQIATGTKTVLSVGPAPKSLVDKVTGNLKLL